MAKVSLRAYSREIEAMIDRGHLDEAVAHCQHILKTFPKHLETYRLLGKAFLEGRHQKEAVDIFLRVLNAEPSDFVAHVGMSIVRDEQNKLDDAIWHMERAFEVQSANSAIQAELQRLYGRRDGMQPPRIRMTRGALAHMYLRGELYPQAISETKSVLEEDQGRSDMQVLLAKAYYKSGQKKDAADAASMVLKRYPYCLEANLVLSEVLGVDRPDSAQVYRHRVIELDPYAAQAVDNMFLANEVSDAAVSLEHLEWDGRPVGMSSDWGTERAISLESGVRDGDAQPDWLKGSLPAESPSVPSAPAFASDQGDSVSSGQVEEEIPDFLKAAGWGASTGAFDESKASAMFEDEPVSPAEPIAEGDLPDWVKAMAPQEASAPAEGQEEEIPDWINKIGTGDLQVPSMEDSTSEQPDWMKGDGGEEQQTSDEQPDWLKSFGEEGQPSDDQQPDLLKGLEEEKPEPFTEEQGQPDWMKGFEQEEQPVPAAEDQLDWLKNFGSESDAVSSTEPTGATSFLNNLKEEEKEPELASPQSSVDTGSLGTSEEEQDDSFAWLENLAAKQGATEGLLTKPEERLEDEPDWIKQAKSLNQPVADQPVPEKPSQKASVPEETHQPSQDVGDLGKSGQEIDDALAWFEGLAAKQGATEGLLTKPEERKEQEPEWVKQAKSAGTGQPPVQKVPVEELPVEEELAPESDSVPQPAVNVEDLGKSGEEIDDALAWFESLAAKQGATEGLLTKPEERKEQEPEWVKQAKQSSSQVPAPQKPAPEPEKPAESEEEPEWMKHARSVGEQFFDVSMGTNEEETSEPAPAQEAMQDDISSWLEGLDEGEAQAEPVPAAEDDTASWLRSLDEPDESSVTASTAEEDLPTWMSDVSGEEIPETESAVLKEETESPVAGDVSSWLDSLKEEEEAPEVASSDGLPAWMRDETGEVVAEPTKIEPTRTSDWTPVDETEEETVEPPPSALKPVSKPKTEPKLEPSTVQEKPAPKAKKPAPKKESVKPATPPEPYKEPVTRRGTGMLTMPVDPVLGSARAELSRSNIPGALETYEKLIKKGRFLEEVIYDLREALYRYPVEVSIWQTLGDAYMRANQLQDALDAYTKAEELLR